MSVSISAKLKLFDKHIIDIYPNPQLPTRIESRGGFQITKKEVAGQMANFSMPIEIAAAMPEVIHVSQIVIDTQTKEFQMGIQVTPGDDFFLTKNFKDIIAVEKLDVFVSYKAATPAEKAAAIAAAKK